MRNIPSVPPSPSAAAEAVDVKPVSYLRALRIVGERSLLPLVFPRHRPAADKEPAGALAAVLAEERRRGAERRKFSRRIRSKGASLYDTRASEERRRGNRRDSDITTKIQEKI
jgi:hypothetical protein